MLVVMEAGNNMAQTGAKLHRQHHHYPDVRTGKSREVGHVWRVFRLHVCECSVLVRYV